MAIFFPFIFLVISCMDWIGWWENVTPKGRATLFTLGLFVVAFLLAGIAGGDGNRK